MVGIDVLTILEVAPLVTLLVAYLKIEFVFVFATNTLQCVCVSAVAPPVAGSTPAFPYTVQRIWTIQVHACTATALPQVHRKVSTRYLSDSATAPKYFT